MINAWLFWMSRKGALVSIPILLLIVGIIKVAYFVSVRSDPLIARKKPPEGTVKPAPPAAPPQYRAEFPSREIDTHGRYRGFPDFCSSTVISNEILMSSGSGGVIPLTIYPRGKALDYWFFGPYGNFKISKKCVPERILRALVRGHLGLSENDPWTKQRWREYWKAVEVHEQLRRNLIEINVYGEMITDFPMLSPFEDLPVLHDGISWVKDL